MTSFSCSRCRRVTVGYPCMCVAGQASPELAQAARQRLDEMEAERVYVAPAKPARWRRTLAAMLRYVAELIAPTPKPNGVYRASYEQWGGDDVEIDS